MHWSRTLIGIPFLDQGRTRAGVDCWGLVRLALAGHGIDVPSYTERYASVMERAEVAAALGAARVAWPWDEVRAGFEQPFDVVLFEQLNQLLHVGVVVTPGQMLHVHRGIDSRIDSYRVGRWAGHLAGIYRHAAR